MMKTLVLYSAVITVLVLATIATRRSKRSEARRITLVRSRLPGQRFTPDDTQ